MACFNHATIIDLAAREMLQLPDVRGTTLRVTRGTVWITQQNDTQDIVLRAGDNWVVERNGTTLVEAVSERKGAGAFIVRRTENGVEEERVEPRLL